MELDVILTFSLLEFLMALFLLVFHFFSLYYLDVLDLV